jgi:hypothetical protein
MPANVVKTKEDEHKWSKAKSIAAKEGKKKDWSYIMGIYNKMKGKKSKKMDKQAFIDGYLKR